MNNALTELIMIIDRSGSMEHLQQETIDTINIVVRAQEAEAGELVDLTVALFDTTVDIVYDGVRSTALASEPLNTRNYKPDGCTALHDAVATVIDRAGKRLADRAEADRPGAVVVVILTDGMENASSNHTLADVAAKIDHQRKEYNWQFLFLGANQDVWETGRAMNLDKDDAHSWSSTRDGMRDMAIQMDASIKIRKERAKRS